MLELVGLTTDLREQAYADELGKTHEQSLVLSLSEVISITYGSCIRNNEVQSRGVDVQVLVILRQVGVFVPLNPTKSCVILVNDVGLLTQSSHFNPGAGNYMEGKEEKGVVTGKAENVEQDVLLHVSESRTQSRFKLLKSTT